MPDIYSLFLYKKSFSVTYDKRTKTQTGDDIIYFYAKYNNEGVDIDDEVYFSAENFNFSPNPCVTPPINFNIIDDAVENLAVGSYIINGIAEAYNLAQTKEFIIYLNIINSDPTDPPEPEKPDTIKYLTEYKNIVGDDFRLEIWQKGFKGLTTGVRGYADFSYQSKKDLFEPIIASSLRIYYEATESLSMTDLYSEVEQTYKAIFKRNGIPLFIGYIKPDGIFEDWVSNRWILDVDAIDGLSTLKNLSFVTDNGNFYVGKLSILETIKNCLHRTGLDLPININIDLNYEGNILGEYSILEDVFINTERYYQDTKKVMDCESIMKSLLQIFNATLFQMNGEWYIIRTIDVKDNILFSRYINGIYENNQIISPIENIGSHINNFEIIHCNENQKKSIAASVQAYRIYYKYGNAKSLAQNSELLTNPDGTANGWIFAPEGGGGFVYRNPSGYGVIVRNNDDTNLNLVNINQSVEIKSGNLIKISVNLTPYLFIERGYIGDVSLYLSTTNYYLKEGVWILKSGSPEERSSYLHIENSENGVSLIWDTTTPPFPEDSIVFISIRIDIQEYLIATEFELYLNSISITPADSNIKGVYYTGQRTSRISSVTKEDVTVYNGDSLSDLFVGTLYKSDSDTPTEKWYRIGRTESLELLNINAEDNLRISPRPMIIFEGDIYGYIPYLSLISINNINGKFLPTDYTYKTKDNVIQLALKEFSSDYLPSDSFTVIQEDDFGNETKVTIK